jgi:hypothetical protein
VLHSGGNYEEKTKKKIQQTTNMASSDKFVTVGEEEIL